VLSEDDLIGFQLAEYAAAAKLKSWTLWLQFAVAVPPALSVFVESNPAATYYLSLSGLVLLLGYVFADFRQRRRREAAEKARRAALIAIGLGDRLSPSEQRDIADSMVATRTQAAAAFRSDYFATTSGAGPKRLAEMVEESAFWTSHLQRASAVFMAAVFGGLFVLFLVVLGAFLPYVKHDALLVSSRIFLVFLVFLLSSDVWGVVLGHLTAADAARDVYKRLDAALARGHSLPDVLLIVSDYNAAAEASPLTVPFVFKTMSGRLNEMWSDYQQSRAAT
jgi:hypothetical protein